MAVRANGALNMVKKAYGKIDGYYNKSVVGLSQMADDRSVGKATRMMQSSSGSRNSQRIMDQRRRENYQINKARDFATSTAGKVTVGATGIGAAGMISAYGSGPQQR